jgi:hypothetical protein
MKGEIMKNFNVLKFEPKYEPKNEMEKRMHEIFIEMTDSELADYVLMMACGYIRIRGLKRETNIMKVLTECCNAGNFICEDGHCSATKMFKIIEINMEILKEVADDDGNFEIESLEGR